MSVAQPYRILMVDDEPNVLAAYRRTAGRVFDLTCAEGGASAMAQLDAEKPFAVIVSDMRMPEMSGLEFILAARQKSKDSVFMMLTGNSDQQTAVDAINKGQIFRFLSKPCNPEQLEAAIRAAIRQHELLTAERVLIRDTVAGSVKLMMDALEMASPLAFSYQSAIKGIQREVCAKLGAPIDWQVGLAASLCLIGLVAVPQTRPDGPLPDESLDIAAEISSRLLSHVPRFQALATMIRHQRDNGMLPADLSATDPQTVQSIGSQVLRFSIDLAREERRCGARGHAVAILAESRRFDPRLIQTIAVEIAAQPQETPRQIQSPPINVKSDAVEAGMILLSDVVLTDGRLLLSKGQTVSELAAISLRHYCHMRLISDRIDVLMPPAA